MSAPSCCPPSIVEALQVLGIRRLLLGIHDPAFPEAAEEDVGRGSPYGTGARKLLRFARSLGFTGIQFGPQGLTSPINASPHDSTLFSRNPLFLALAPLTTKPWGELLGSATLDRLREAVSGTTGTDHGRVNHLSYATVGTDMGRDLDVRCKATGSGNIGRACPGICLVSGAESRVVAVRWPLWGAQSPLRRTKLAFLAGDRGGTRSESVVAPKGRSGHVYRSENARPEDWIMLGNHDTPPIWRLVDQWQSFGGLRQQAEYLAWRLEADSSQREAWVQRLVADPGELVQAKVADLFAGPAGNVMIFFTNLFGNKALYNQPGVISDENWSLRIDADFDQKYRQDVVLNRAINLPRALALAIRSKGKSFAVDHASLLSRLDGLAVQPGGDGETGPL